MSKSTTIRSRIQFIRALCYGLISIKVDGCQHSVYTFWLYIDFIWKRKISPSAEVNYLWCGKYTCRTIIPLAKWLVRLGRKLAIVNRAKQYAQWVLWFMYTRCSKCSDVISPFLIMCFGQLLSASQMNENGSANLAQSTDNGNWPQVTS